MESTIKITSVRVYSANDIIRYRVHFDSKLDGIVINEHGKYVDGQVDHIDFVPSVLIAQIIDLVPGVNIMYTKKKEQAIRTNTTGFGAAELAAILQGSTIIVDRDKFKAGSEYTLSDQSLAVHEHDGYTTKLISVTCSTQVQKALDRLIESMFVI